MNGQRRPLFAKAGAHQKFHEILWTHMGVLLTISLIEWIKVALHWRIEGPASLAHSPLASAQDRFSDWTNFLPRVAAFGRPDLLTSHALGLPYPYPAPSFFILLAYVRVFSMPTAAFIWTVVLIFVGAAILLSLYMYRRSQDSLAVFSICATLVFGFPAFFLLDRGNIEIFVWLLSILGIVSFAKYRNLSAAVLFALAASLKIYPAVFFLLFLRRHRYGAFALAAVCTVSVSIAAIMLIGPDTRETLNGLVWSAQLLRANQVGIVQEVVLRWDHSAFALYKQGIYTYLHWKHHRPESTVQFFRSIRPYTLLAGTAFVTTYVWRLRHLPLLNQYVCLTIASVVLPYVSYEYTLVNLYGPFAALLLWLMEPQTTEVLSRLRIAPYVVAVSFAVLFAPLYVLAFREFNGQIKAALLLLLFVLFATKPLPSQVFGDAAGEQAVP